MGYNKIRKMDISDGPGVRVSIFMQGCAFNCKNCFNPETHDFNGGKEFTDATIDRILELSDNDNIMYAELNTKSDYCQKCGYTGEILIDDKLEWYCPNCGNRDHNTLNVARRTCGYIGTNFWNKGRTQEIKERVLHIDNKVAD